MRVRPDLTYLNSSLGIGEMKVDRHDGDADVVFVRSLPPTSSGLVGRPGLPEAELEALVAVDSSLQRVAIGDGPGKRVVWVRAGSACAAGH